MTTVGGLVGLAASWSGWFPGPAFWRLPVTCGWDWVMRWLAIEPQGSWASPGPLMSGMELGSVCKARGLGATVACGWVRPVPDVSGCGTWGVPVLVSADWWVELDPEAALEMSKFPRAALSLLVGWMEACGVPGLLLACWWSQVLGLWLQSPAGPGVAVDLLVGEVVSCRLWVRGPVGPRAGFGALLGRAGAWTLWWMGLGPLAARGSGAP